ncbi:MAG: hypothetical protein V4622_11475 [Bacteroidota bacterium]
MKNLILITAVFLVSNMFAQENFSKMEKMFQKETTVDIELLDDVFGGKLIYNYYIENGILYLGSNSILISDIDFSKKYIGQQIFAYKVSKTGLFSQQLRLVPKPSSSTKKELDLYFESIEDCELAFNYLKYQAEKTNVKPISKTTFDVEKIFLEETERDLEFKDFLGTIYILNYYLKENNLHLKGFDYESQWELSSFDFTGKTITKSEKEKDNLTGQLIYKLKLSPKPTIKMKGCYLIFKSEEDAEKAFAYLKKQSEKPYVPSKTVIKKAIPTKNSNFSNQISQIICGSKNNFESLRGEVIVQSVGLYKCKIQLEGAKETEVLSSQLKADFGRIENDEEIIKQYEELKNKITNTLISCGTLKLDKEERSKAFMLYTQTWKVENSSDPKMKNLQIELSISGHSISLKLILVPEGGFLDDDDDW